MELVLKKGTVNLSNYNAEWLSLFDQEATLIRRILSSDGLPVEHIGSTSIPDVPCKPIIDLMVAFETIDSANAAVAVLVGHGYIRRHNGDMSDRLFIVKGQPAWRTHHVSLTTMYSNYWITHLFFRDCLRRDKELADEYTELIIYLASRCPNEREKYTAGELDFVDRVLRAAENHA